MALGVSWMGWRRPAAPHGQQRRGYSDQNSGRSRDVVVGCVTFEMQGDKNWVCGDLDCFRGVVGGLACAKGLWRSRCGCSDDPISRNGGFSPVNQPTTRHQFAWPASVRWHMPRLGAQTPQIEINFRRNSTK